MTWKYGPSTRQQRSTSFFLSPSIPSWADSFIRSPEPDAILLGTLKRKRQSFLYISHDICCKVLYVCLRHKSAKSWILNRLFYTTDILLANPLHSQTDAEETGKIKTLNVKRLIRKRLAKLSEPANLTTIMATFFSHPKYFFVFFKFFTNVELPNIPWFLSTFFFVHLFLIEWWLLVVSLR
jgi:hypothetical protein